MGVFGKKNYQVDPNWDHEKALEGEKSREKTCIRVYQVTGCHQKHRDTCEDKR